MAGEIHFPANFDLNKKYDGVVVSHPSNGVKEQVAGLYAQKLAENGFIGFAFDASYQGESEGLSRYLDGAFNRVEDIRCAINYLVTLPYIDENRIGAMGICAGAGYAINATQTKYRRSVGIANVMALPVNRQTNKKDYCSGMLLHNALVKQRAKNPF